MKVNSELLHKLAGLSRLKIDPEKEDLYLNDLSKILDWMEKLNEVDTEGVKPLTHMSEELNVTREDVLREHLDHEKALKNAPKKDSDYFRVPKVINS